MSAECRSRGGGGGLLIALLLFSAACDRQAQEGPNNADLLKVAAEAEELVASAPLIVIARVAEISTGRTTAGLTFDDVRFQVLNTLKGDPNAAVVMEQPAGGSLDSPSFEPGERYLLLLRPSRTEEGRHVAVPQGRYQLVDGRLDAFTPGPVADAWDGMELERVTEAIRASVDR